MALTVDLVSPEQLVYTGEADMVVVRTTEGEIAFMTGHTPIVGALAVASARIYQTDGEIQHIAVHRGFVEVSRDDHVTILSDMAELAEVIDTERALRAKERAEEELHREEENEAAAAALKRATVRLETAEALIHGQ